MLKILFLVVATIFFIFVFVLPIFAFFIGITTADYNYKGTDMEGAQLIDPKH
jgi:hypothetical protein